MLAMAVFVAGLVLAGYGVAKWFREREDAVLAEIAQHYEHRQRLLSTRIDEGDRALRVAYADLDRLEQQRTAADRRMQALRVDLDGALASKTAAEKTLERRTGALATAEVQLERLRRARVALDQRRTADSADATSDQGRERQANGAG